MKTTILIATLLALVPGAAAIDPVCVAEAATCVSTQSYESGSCESGEGYSETVRRVNVDSGSDHLSVGNYCYRYSEFGYEESGSGIGVNYYRYDENTGEYRAFGVQWYNYDWSGGSFCEITAYSYGNDPFPNGGNPAPCVDGGPGVIVPALP